MQRLIFIILFLPLFLSAQPTDRTPADTCKRHSKLYRVDRQRAFLYEKPGWVDFLKKTPGDLKTYLNQSIHHTKLDNLLGMAAFTGLFIQYDQQIYDAAKEIGRRVGIRGDTALKTRVRILGYPIRFPVDLGTSLYFIGDGWTHVGVTLSFLTYGLLKNDYRALSTASQLSEGLLTVAIVTQTLKHITGRESPFTASVDRGVWRFFPNQITYHKHVPKYDAYPSGHMATILMAITIISDNYPEYKFIKPVGYFLMTLLGYQMLNNGVHWISDYPLGFAIGYSLGKIVVMRNRKVLKRRSGRNGGLSSVFKSNEIDFSPQIYRQGGMGLGLVIRF